MQDTNYNQKRKILTFSDKEGDIFPLLLWALEYYRSIGEEKTLSQIIRESVRNNLKTLKLEKCNTQHNNSNSKSKQTNKL